ncbi:MAG: hypothetical protein M1833_003767 [Piccolia ochrophora]|nr:MAG: hypothetical protein M1833_003767 [Piccolia ochrophora]
MTLKGRFSRLLFTPRPTLFGYQRLPGLVVNTAKAAAFFHLFTEYFFSVKLTYGPSMLPTINVRDDYVIISKLYARGRGIQVGDIVNFKHPMFPNTGAVKRVLGMPGDFVLRDSPGSEKAMMIQVPKGHCWVIGDDLGSSRDSRLYGPIPLALIKGRALAKVVFPRFWSPQYLDRSITPLHD